MSNPLADGAVRYPGHRWGCLADDPWNPEVDRTVGDAWERALEHARAVREAASGHHQASSVPGKEGSE